ncbi:FAD-dependent oxidoreductase [uncultured Desulfosarcina sp.]|uniref:FAD-dependent oxidoreductase n=1 Tax=uncultured Desulfosarcina sp. TaxID=218289 RepID=UPI0029C92435|nr:FAD-dependent oxidoreductase [uncultured Desulfosarcina sp.]
MSDSQCPVTESIHFIDDVIGTGGLKHPKSRRIAEEIHSLLDDVAWGRAGDDHLPAVQALIQDLLIDTAELEGYRLGEHLHQTIKTHGEVFESHVKTHNCPTGTCEWLTPAPCQMACPAGIDVPTYVTLIGQGRDAEAIDVIRRDNPFPWVCGLVCTRPCEFMCVRGRMDTPVSIKFLKAFAAERAMSEGTYRNPDKAPDQGKRICVIGAGPGGLSAAYYLALKGYGVHVIEALPTAGGMIMVGIPRYRLPREVIDREVAMLEELGVTFAFNTRFGEDVTLDDLNSQGYEAFFFAIGAHKAYKLGIPGETDFPQTLEAIDLLRRVALGDRRMPGKRVVVVGGGNVAIDAARTCLRLGCPEVTIAYRRTRHEMPADEEEVEQAEEEGVRFSFLTIPAKIVGENNKITALSCVRAQLVQREGSSRMSPVPVLGSEYAMDADVVISAIGQKVDQLCMGDLKSMGWTRRGTIDVNMVTMETSLEGVFAAGDAVTGPATVIEAIGGGKRAAEAIDRYLLGIPQPQMPPVPVRRRREPCIELPASTKTVIKRPTMDMLNLDRRRTTFQQVELGYTENMVREEARRCLRCDICRRCGRCVEICRDKMGISALEMGYLNFDHPGHTDLRVTEERCIACGACAANCPTGAMRIEDRGDERLLILCGTILNRQKLVFCSSCGKAMGPKKYLDFINKRVRSVGQMSADTLVCEDCARTKTARFNVDTLPV